MPLEVALGQRYLVVSPVKDEAAHVRRTLDSMVRQTVLPLRWVIVDDGSSDETPRILKEYADQHAWIQVVRVGARRRRELGITEIKAFALGFERVRSIASDFVVKLDCDLDLPADYFERICSLSSPSIQSWGSPRVCTSKSQAKVRARNGCRLPCRTITPLGPRRSFAGSASTRSMASSCIAVGIRSMRSRRKCAAGKATHFANVTLQALKEGRIRDGRVADTHFFTARSTT